MCGIAGIVSPAIPPTEARSVVERMSERIAHRGPDGGGIVVHTDATLGMKRLAIVDVVHGHQPMANEDESVVVVYNGEIYNAPVLRQQLERDGTRFRTRSDTEVILRLYEKNPEHVEELLVGMWAFALHDRARRRLILSRDRFGIKPLFLAEAGRTIAFASELGCFDRSLSALAGCFEIDRASAHAMLTWSYVPECSTIYTGVRRLEPATRLELDLATGGRRERRYWELRPDAEAATVGSMAHARVQVEALLRRSVREHLESDVPVSVFLSGGIDSSLVAWLAAEESERPIKAFAIGFDEVAFDESRYARASAEKLGIDIEVRRLDEDSARAALADALLAYDEPFGDSSSLATYLLCAHAATEYKVALGGDGGDEIFAGYRKHMMVKLRRPFRHLPVARRWLGHALGRLPTRTDRTRGWTEFLRSAQRLSLGFAGNDADAYVLLTQVVPLARTAPLLSAPGGAEQFVEVARNRFVRARGSELQRTLAGDLGGPLVNDMLVKVDRASMASHLEARVPFLDHRVVEFGVGLPEHVLVGNQGKRVLREIHARRFGRALASRKKQGFRVPVEAWLRGPLDAACTRLFAKKRIERTGILSADALANGGHRRWAETDPVLLWHAFALAAWLEANHGNGPDALRELLST